MTNVLESGAESEAARRTLVQAVEDLEMLPTYDPPGAEEPALELARRADLLGLVDLVHQARLVYADAISRQGQIAAAATIVREVNDWATEHSHRMLLARSERLLVPFYAHIGDAGAALEHAVRSVELLEPDDRPRLHADHLMGLAFAYVRSRSFDAARDRYVVVEQLAEEIGDVGLLVSTLNNLACVEQAVGTPESAMRAANRLKETAERHQYQPPASILDTIARAQMQVGDFAGAEQTLQPVLSEGADRLITESDDLAEILITVSECQRMIGATDRARASVDRAAAICEEQELEQAMVAVMEERAAVLAADGDFEGAYTEHLRFHAANQAIFASERDAKARILATVFEKDEAVRSSKRFREMSLRDPLTGLYNRRYVEDRGPSMLARAEADATFLSVAILDLDHFKSINDTFSHEVGDEVLRRVAEQLRTGAPDGGFAARLGGEEFLLVMPGLDAGAAVAWCDALRLAIGGQDWTDCVGTEREVTTSIGVATAFAGAVTFSDLLGRADEYLYEAKNSGRNKVCSRPTP